MDSSHVAAGGVQVASTMGTTIGPSAFFTGFNLAGVQVEQGHETMISDSWFAEYYWSDSRQNATRQCPKDGGDISSSRYA